VPRRRSVAVRCRAAWNGRPADAPIVVQIDDQYGTLCRCCGRPTSAGSRRLRAAPGSGDRFASTVDPATKPPAAGGRTSRENASVRMGVGVADHRRLFPLLSATSFWPTIPAWPRKRFDKYRNPTRAMSAFKNKKDKQFRPAIHRDTAIPVRQAGAHSAFKPGARLESGTAHPT